MASRFARYRWPAHDRAKRASRRQENLRTIHKHNVVAERHGLLGQLRRKVNLGERVRHHVTKRDWLEDVCGPEKPERAVAVG